MPSSSMSVYMQAGHRIRNKYTSDKKRDSRCFSSGPGVSLTSLSTSIDVNPNALFPPVVFPAPRGTPLISPHIKWDHSQTWDVPAAEDFPNGSSSSSATVYNIGEPGLVGRFLPDLRAPGLMVAASSPPVGHC